MKPQMKYDAGAVAYDRLTGRWSRLYARSILDAAAASSSRSLLDVATGTGDAAVLANDCVPAAGVVVGVDISVPMLRVAACKALQSNVSFAAADAMRMPFRDRTFDSVICQFGLMFLPDKAAGLAEFRRVLRPAGRVALSVWGEPHQAPFAGIMAQALGEALPANREELLIPFSLADPAHLLQLMERAGFQKPTVQQEIQVARFDSPADFMEPYEQGGGRLGQAYLQLTPEIRLSVRHAVLKQLESFRKHDQIAMEVIAYVASGTA
jgi:ubiquinone/menaquinone biosynthesis C-methylase UbiE